MCVHLWGVSNETSIAYVWPNDVSITKHGSLTKPPPTSNV